MPLTTVGIRVKDFSRETVPGARVIFHPQGMGNLPPRADVFVSKPVSGAPSAVSDYLYIELEEGFEYRMEIIWTDQGRSRTGQSWWSEKFTVPSSDSVVPLPQVIGLPPENGTIQVNEGNPAPGDSAQFVINETTGDLYQRQ